MTQMDPVGKMQLKIMNHISGSLRLILFVEVCRFGVELWVA